MKRRGILFLPIVMIGCLWLVASAVSAGPAASPPAPIDPAVLAELDRSADGQADFLVYFK